MVRLGKKGLVKRSIRHMSPRHIIRSRLTQRTVRRIANKYGLVYFGAVDQRADDFKLIRGFTISRTQIDDLYTVGTVQGYDTSFVARNDLVLTRGRFEKRCHWFIVAVDLHTDTTLPHLYVGPQASNDIFEAAYSQLRPAFLGNTAQYPAKFTSNYSVYARPADIIEIERLFPPMVASVIVSHFGNMSFELSDNTVYVYSESKYPNQAVIDKMLQNAIWLAKIFDAVSSARQVLEES